MAIVWIPSLLRALTGGLAEHTVDAATVGELIERLDERYPGIKDRLMIVEENRIRPSLAVVVDGVASRQGVRHPLEEQSEVHFVPAMSGGSEAVSDAVPATATPRASLRQIMPLLIALVVTLIAAIAGIYFRDSILALGRYGLIGVFLINLINNATVILPAPFGLVATCVLANSAAPLIVGAVAGLGSGLGEYTSFLAGAGGNAVIPHGRIYTLMRYYMRKAGPAVIFILSAIPNPFFDVGGLIAGALKMPLGMFMLMTIAGKIVRYSLLSYLCATGSPLIRSLMGN